MYVSFSVYWRYIRKELLIPHKLGKTHMYHLGFCVLVHLGSCNRIAPMYSLETITIYRSQFRGLEVGDQLTIVVG